VGAPHTTALFDHNSVIDTIAFQINILSSNAAVEAVRRANKGAWPESGWGNAGSLGVEPQGTFRIARPFAQQAEARTGQYFP
jgi:hypothetical protein